MAYFRHITNVYKKTFQIRGRASLSEGLCYYSLWFGIMVLAIVLLTHESNPFAKLLSILCGIFLLVSLIPMITLSIRRLHDQNFSGWFMLLILFPIIDFFVIYMLMSPRDKWDNKYGKFNDTTEPNENINKAWD